MVSARERWADLTNEMLEGRGRDERVDHRSYERQGIDLTPGEHYGPAAARMAARGVDHDRLEESVGRAECQEALRAIDRRIAAIEDGERGGGRGAMDRGGDESKRRQDHHGTDRDRLDDFYPGR